MQSRKCISKVKGQRPPLLLCSLCAGVSSTSFTSEVKHSYSSLRGPMSFSHHRLFSSPSCAFTPLSDVFMSHCPLSSVAVTRPSCCCAQRQFGVDGSGGYCRQVERAMERAVTKGLMSPVEFHCRKAEMMETLASGVDDGTTRTSSKSRSNQT